MTLLYSKTWFWLLSPETTISRSSPANVASSSRVRLPSAASAAPSPRKATLSFYAVIGRVIGCHSLGIYIIILLALLSFSAEMSVSPVASRACHLAVSLAVGICDFVAVGRHHRAEERGRRRLSAGESVIRC